jgi:hypothetical protein
MRRAKSLGIDAFALNIRTDSYSDERLGYAYESAANNGMKVFISFDFNWYHDTSDAATVGQKIAQNITTTATPNGPTTGKLFFPYMDCYAEVKSGLTLVGSTCASPTSPPSKLVHPT